MITSEHTSAKPPFDSLKPNSVPNKTHLNTLDPDFCMGQHQIILTNRNQPPEYACFFCYFFNLSRCIITWEIDENLEILAKSIRKNVLCPFWNVVKSSFTWYSLMSGNLASVQMWHDGYYTLMLWKRSGPLSWPACLWATDCFVFIPLFWAKVWHLNAWKHTHLPPCIWDALDWVHLSHQGPRCLHCTV